MGTDTKNLGGRPEIGGKIGPVSYGDSLLAEIDRRAAAAGQSRSAWLRDVALHAANATAPETLAWSQMTDAGIDIDLVDKTQACKAGASNGDQWVATSADGKKRVYFGIAEDPENVIPEGQHKGWDIGWYDLETEDGDDHPTEYFSSNEYYEPYDVAGLLADVAAVCPIGE